MIKRFQFNKLIRDRIPEILKGNGVKIYSHTLEDKSYKKALKMKLEEEISEINSASTKDELLEELSDLYEAMEALANAYGISQKDLKKAKIKKLAAKGSFDNRIFVNFIEIPKDSPALTYYLERADQYPEII